MASKHVNKSKESATQKDEGSSMIPVLLKARQVLYETLNSAPCPKNPFFIEKDQNASYKRGLLYLLIEIDNKKITSQNGLLRAMNAKAKELQSDVFNNLVKKITGLFETDLVQDSSVDYHVSGQDKN
jgi:soluble cytochrome b562